MVKGPTMRDFLFVFLLLTLFPTANAAPRPNILFIAIDDQNDWIGCLGGHPQVKTPNIDGLGRRGTVFLNAHCQSPLCNPSRTSLMTGLRPSTTGIYGLSPWFRAVEEWKDRVTLPQHLSANGYRTFSTGKIYHGGYGRRKNDREFDELGPPATAAPFPENGKLVRTPSDNKLVDWGTFPHRDEDKGDWKIASWVVEKLEELGREKSEKPFFLSAGFFLPHVPCYATRKWFDLYPEDSLYMPAVLPGDRDDTPRFSWYMHWKLPEPRKRFLDEQGQWKNLVRSYMACTSFVDAQVGRVLKALSDSGLEEDTIVVLWSDHGWHLGEKLITGKNTLWDDGTRVPLIFAGPGVNKGLCWKPAELLDIYPTLIDLCELEQVAGLEGHSLTSQLADASAPREWPAITTHNHDNHGVRSEHWRYIRYADGSEELYDMRRDPNEWRNLAGSPGYQTVLNKHREYLPATSARPAPGSRHRILTYDPEGETIWEGQAIRPDAPVPEL